MAALAHDTCRCHDADCKERHECLRWLHRNDRGRRIVHADRVCSGYGYEAKICSDPAQ